MTESKLLEQDKDEWFYQSMERYSHLYMFELEFPIDALEVINDTSICLSGVQTYSKKCEILQLSIPPKLLPKDIEEGLCKDRDFQITSGGYASSRITQVKPIKSCLNFVAAVEQGKNGVTIFKLGDENHAIIVEMATLPLPLQEFKLDTHPGVIDTKDDRIIAGSYDGKFLYEWKFDSGKLDASLGTKYDIGTNLGRIEKIKFWDENNVAFSTVKGVVSLFDLRESKKAGVTIYAAKSPLLLTELYTNNQISSSSSNLIFSFDSLPGRNKIGIVDSCGGYESFDIRCVKKKDDEGQRDRIILPGCANAPGVLGGRFNIEYEPERKGQESLNCSTSVSSDENNCVNFIVTGMKQECVQVYKETKNLESEITPVFLHDGHSKPVSHALWHPNSEQLLFSASVDAVLHAWQYAGYGK